MELGNNIFVDSPNVYYTNDYIEATYEYTSTSVERVDQRLVARPMKTQLRIRTGRRVPRLGVMLVGWGGNNGTTFTAGVLANALGLSWATRWGTTSANWYGSITQASTLRLGASTDSADVYVPFSSLLPMVSPDDLVIDGWDISSMDLAAAMERAQVLDVDLQRQLKPHMAGFRPKPSPYFPDFIAANQAERADNIMEGSKGEQLALIRKDIANLKQKVEKVIVMWTANTERFSSVLPGVNDNAENLLNAISSDHSEVSPSTLFAVAAILEGCAYINGSPQNTFVPGCIELAEQHNVFIAGDDFKSGQTKFKSVLVDFLVNAGIKPVSITSYNHLGNNDGKNLSAPNQFKSKEISKSSVIDDMVASNPILYKPGEKIDHTVVIKYVPYVGDSKRAMDEYISQIMLGGHNTIAIHNTCEDSLLAAPIMLDLIILAELASRVQFSSELDPENFTHFHPVLSVLSYMCKAPLVPPGAPVVNALTKQKACIENILRACLGLPPEHYMSLEHKIPPELFKVNSAIV